MHLGLGTVARQVLGELNCIEQAGRRVGRPRQAKRGSQRRLGTRRRLAYLGHGAGEQQHHTVAVVHRVNELGQVGLRLAKPAGRNVGRLHRCRHVENGDDEPPALQFAGEIRAGQREHSQCQQDQLNDEQPVVPEFLERRTGLRLVEEALPQDGARDQPRHSPTLEQIKNNDDRQRGRERERLGREKIHRHMPPVRMALSSRSAIGVSEHANW